MIIDSFKIEGFWGRYVVKGKLYPDVNIFIGANGTGKTTLINILVAALRINIPTLEAIPFKSINIKLKEIKGRKKTPSINVIKKSAQDLPYTVFEYVIDRKKYKIFSDPRRRFMLRHRHMSHEPASLFRGYEAFKEVIDKLVEISWISVYRHSSVEPRDDDRKRFDIDRRLEELTDYLAKYQLRLENKIRDRSQQFQKDVIESLIYSKKLDDLSNFRDMKKEIGLKYRNEQELIHAFQELGITGKETQIKQHFKAIQKAIRNIKSGKPTTLSDISPLPFATRTERIVQLLDNSERDKELIRKPIKTFLETLHMFMSKKIFRIDESTGELRVNLIKADKGLPLTLWDLSSGEKQLLIQFLEVLLQENRPVLFFADEPELSLHVEWQEKLLPSLRRLNSNSQIIVATHSPDIVSEYNEKIIHMEDVIKNGI